MSLNAYWEPWSPKPRSIEAKNVTDSQFIQALVEAFGPAHDFKYTAKDLPMLKAMAAANLDYGQLVEAVEAYGAIRVWGES